VEEYLKYQGRYRHILKHPEMLAKVRESVQIEEDG
jgi:hypothetical protein